VIRTCTKDAGELVDYYLVPSEVVARETTVEKSSTGSIWYAFYLKSAQQYKDAWTQLQSA